VRCEQPLTHRFPNGETHLYQLILTSGWLSSWSGDRVNWNEGITEVNT
jgi:hypothetical protein